MRPLSKTPAQIIGEILRHIRKDAGLGKEEMAEHLGYGTRGSISHFETGERRISFWEFVEFCRACNEDPGEVLDALLKTMPGPFHPPKEEA